MDRKTINHYRTYMKIYGTLIVELADDETEVLKLIDGHDLGPLLLGLRDHIENSPFHEKS